MHRRELWCIVLLGLLISACQGAPPTQIVLVVTATPQSEAVAQEVAREPAPPARATEEDAQVLPFTGSALTPLPTAIAPASGQGSLTPVPLSRTTALPQPTPTIRQIQVAEQIFERGRMFWLQPTRQIWVMVVSREGAGEWFVYEDFFREGDPESDPSLVPPDEELQQPIRGFGRLWRDRPRVRELLGWATSDEFGFVTRYEFHPAPGQSGSAGSSAPYHVLFSLYGEGFRFNDVENGRTWELN